MRIGQTVQVRYANKTWGWLAAIVASEPVPGDRFRRMDLWVLNPATWPTKVHHVKGVSYCEEAQGDEPCWRPIP